MEKCVLFGAGKIASKIHEKYKEEIVAVIDNDPSKIGLYIWDDIPIISLKDYKDDYSFLPIMITTVYCKNIEKQLRDNNITNFFIPDELWRSGNVEISQNISHSRWPLYLKQLCDYEGKDVEGKIVLAGVDQFNVAWIDMYMEEAALHKAAALVTYDNGGYGTYDDDQINVQDVCCLLYTSPSPRDCS